MRWISNKKLYDSGQRERTIKLFLLFPLKVNNEYRWLEWVNIKQKLVFTPGGCDEWESWDDSYNWTDVEYVDPPEAFTDHNEMRI